MRFMIQRLLYLVRPFSLAFFLVALTLGLSACRAQPADSNRGNTENDDSHMLGLIGYNYTSHYIDNYSVNGAGGGNIMVSSPTSGGSGLTCCVAYSKNPSNRPLRVRVRWQVGGCTYTTRSRVSGTPSENIHSFYRQAEVEVSRIAGITPQYLEIHFYPDGSVQAQLTEDFSSPRLQLDAGRADRTAFPKCPNDKKPS